MHGARNDFVIVDTRRHPIEEPIAFARWACDRHTGIGADGLLLIGESSRGDVSMRVINQDGSEAEMCGNGVRCVARYLDERGEGSEQRIETIAGIIETTVIQRGPVYEIRAAVNTPRLLPLCHPELVEGRDVIVEVGNPHLVSFRSSLEDVDLAVEGERLQHDPHFPDGINVHVCTIEDTQTLRVRHYERGAGLTMACGTGAVGCAAAAILRGAVCSPVTVEVPGGTLRVEWDGTGEAYMTGPAAHVFDAVLDERVPA
jgi:diaminopimelate epimerase